MIGIFDKKNILLKTCFLGVSLFLLAFIFLPLKTTASDACGNSCNYCSAPSTPSSLSWIVVGNDETALEPAWGVSPNPDYFHITGSADANISPGSTWYYYHSGLNPGTYYSYQVQSCNNGGGSGCQECLGSWPDAYCSGLADSCSSYSSGWGATTAFHAPTSLGISSCFLTGGDDAEATIGWTDNSNAESGFKVECKYSTEGTFSECGSTGVNSTSYTQTGLLHGRDVDFRVYAYHNSGTYTDYTGTVSCTLPISAPGGLTATANSGNCNRIDLAWYDFSYGEQGFSIERKLGSGSYSEIAAVGAGVTSYADTSASQGQLYTYRIRAYYGSNYSNYSGEASATSCLTTPTSLSCLAYNNTQINLSWTDNSTGETGFKVERSASGCGSFAQVATTDANVATYENAGLSENTTYCYKVRAYTASQNSSYTSNVSCATQGPPTMAPSSLTATAISDSQINLSWTDNSSNEDSFRVRRIEGASCNSSTGIVTTLDSNSVSYSNSGLASGVQYCYVVCAYNNYGELCSSSQTAITTLGVPSGLTATSGSGNTINLAWTDGSSAESGFKIERATATCTASFAQVGTTTANTVAYADSSGSSNTTYCYRVRAYSDYANSSYSNTASATTKNPPTAPTGLSLSVASESQINLSWTDASSNETGFRIRRAQGSSCDASSTEVTTVAAGSTSYNNTGLSQGTQYCYVVCSYNADGDACSSSQTAITTIPAPSAVSYNSINSTSLVIAWADNSNNESGFKIERAAGGCASGFSQIGTASANATTYSDALSCSGTSYSSYCYRVRANSAYTDSTYATATTTKATLPCAPSNLGLTVASSTQINLSWTDSSGNESGFKIEQKLNSGGTYAQVGTASADASSYSATGLSDGSIYYFKIRPYNTDGSSSYSNEVFATTTLPAPSNFTCTSVNSSEIALAWTDNSTNETGFKLERATTSPPSIEIATLGQVASYNDSNLSENILYYYRLRAYNSNIYSNYTSECSTRTLIYVPHGYFESAIFDTGATNGVSFNYIMWKGTLPSSSHVRFQLATSNATSTLNYLGPDGTASTYYEPSGPDVPAIIKTKYHNNNRYFRYKVFLYPTADNTQSPTVTNVVVGYSP